MSFGGGTSAQPAHKNKQLGLNDYSGASNEQANPLPYFAGKRRFAGTFITDAFNQYNQILSSGGKDSGKNASGGSGVNYYCSFAVAFCLGPVDSFQGLYLNGDAVYTQKTPLRPRKLSQVSNTATFISINPHGYAIAETFTVVITGAEQTEFNGEFLATATSANEFTYTIPGSFIAAETASGKVRAWIKLDPIYRGDEDWIEVTIPDYGLMRLYWGTETQTADDYLTTSGTRHPAMRGVCYAVFKNFFIGLNQTNIQNAEIELGRTPQADWIGADAAAIEDEANPAVVFYELLTHRRGGIGLTEDDFDLPTLAAAAAQFKAEGLGISPLVNRADEAGTIASQICESVDADILLVNGKIALQPIRKPADYAGLPVIGDDELAGLPRPKIAGWADTKNLTRLVFPNRDAAYTNDFVEWRDFGSTIAARQVVQPQTLQRDWITRRSVAALLVQAAGLAGAIPSRIGTVEVIFTPARWAALAPGNLFKLDYSLRPEGGGIFRVTKRTLMDPAQPKFEIQFALDRSYLNLTS